MMRRAATGSSAQAFAWLAVPVAWAVYLPLGAKYSGYLACGLLAALWLKRSEQLAAAFRQPALWMPAVAWLMLLATAAWTTAPPADVASHIWHYGRALFVPLVAMACPAAAAQRALRHFAIASAVVGGLVALDAMHLLPASRLWSSTAGANGNQRIVTSLLLALGAVLALIEAAQLGNAGRSPSQRAAWLLAALLAALGLALQDRRTGMLALPLLLAVLVVARQRSGWRSGALLAALVALAALTWQQADGVRARFAEGLAELRAYEPGAAVATSWGMRLRMAEVTLEMVREKPALGHGIGSWLGEWRQRAHGGHLLEEQLTPHNEYLLIAAQAGLVGLSLWLAVLAAALASAWRSGQQGNPALMVWTAIAWAALFNVVLRDATMAMPLLLLAGLAMAAGRDGVRDP